MPSNDADGNIPTDNLEDLSIFRRPVRTYVIRAGRKAKRRTQKARRAGAGMQADRRCQANA